MSHLRVSYSFRDINKWTLRLAVGSWVNWVDSHVHRGQLLIGSSRRASPDIAIYKALKTFKNGECDESSSRRASGWQRQLYRVDTTFTERFGRRSCCSLLGGAGANDDELTSENPSPAPIHHRPPSPISTRTRRHSDVIVARTCHVTQSTLPASSRSADWRSVAWRDDRQERCTHDTCHIIVPT